MVGFESYKNWTNDNSSHFEHGDNFNNMTWLKIKITVLILFMLYMVFTANVVGAMFVGLLLILSHTEEIVIFERDEAYKIRKLNR